MNILTFRYCRLPDEEVNLFNEVIESASQERGPQDRSYLSIDR